MNVKNLTLILLLLLNVGQFVALINRVEENVEPTTAYEYIGDINIVDEVVTTDAIQEVKFINGDVEVFNSHFHIEDIRLRRLYITYSNMKIMYGMTVDELKAWHLFEEDVDFILFNSYLARGEIGTLSKSEYLEKILNDHDRNQIKNNDVIMSKTGFTLLIFSVIIITMIIMILVYLKINKKIEDSS